MALQRAEEKAGSVTAARQAELRSAIERDYTKLVNALMCLVRAVEHLTDRERLIQRTDEVMGEVTRQALSSAEGYDPGRAVTPWLMTIARNVLRGEYRANQRQTRRIEDPGDRDWAAVLRFIDPGEGQAALRIDVEAMLSRLRPASRKVVEGRFWQGLDWDELAEAIGARSGGAARVRLCRALKELRSQIGDPNQNENENDREARA